MAFIFKDSSADFSLSNIGSSSAGGLELNDWGAVPDIEINPDPGGGSYPVGSISDPDLKYLVVPRIEKVTSEQNLAGIASVEAKGGWVYHSNRATSGGGLDESFDAPGFRDEVGSDGFTVFVVAALNPGISGKSGATAQQYLFSTYGPGSSLALNNFALRSQGKSGEGNEDHIAFVGVSASDTAEYIRVDRIDTMLDGTTPVVYAAAFDLPNKSVSAYAADRQALGGVMADGMGDVLSAIQGANLLGRYQGIAGGNDPGDRDFFLIAVVARPMGPTEVEEMSNKIVSFLSDNGVPNVIGIELDG